MVSHLDPQYDLQRRYLSLRAGLAGKDLALVYHHFSNAKCLHTEFASFPTSLPPLSLVLGGSSITCFFLQMRKLSHIFLDIMTSQLCTGTLSQSSS